MLACFQCCQAKGAAPDIEDVPRPVCVQLGPNPKELAPGGGPAGGKYAWCKCGLSKNQPFCDGSHRKAVGSSGKTLEPHIFGIDEKKSYYLCACKATKNPPFCDGSHMKLDPSQVGKPLPK